jgi:N-formylglutamate deformylase
MTDLFRFTPGSTPVLISVPHAGTHVPPEILDRLTPEARALPDTDWHVDRLYEFAPQLGVGLLVATHSRYVVDLNRDPAGTPLYPGADNTETVPLATFASAPVYRAGAAPNAAEVQQRIDRYWRPYHDRLATEIAALRRRFGIAVLWDGHSIASRVPRFFEGRLPDLNLGSGSGTTADPGLIRRMADLLAGSGFSSVLDGRFKGGYITRHYGQPQRGVHALQLEMAEIAYMDEAPPYRYDAARAARLIAVLREAVAALLAWAQAKAAA